MQIEHSHPKVMDFLEIKDVDSGEVLVRQRGENQQSQAPEDENS